VEDVEGMKVGRETRIWMCTGNLDCRTFKLGESKWQNCHKGSKMTKMIRTQTTVKTSNKFSWMAKSSSARALSRWTTKGSQLGTQVPMV